MKDKDKKNCIKSINELLDKLEIEQQEKQKLIVEVVTVLYRKGKNGHLVLANSFIINGQTFDCPSKLGCSILN